MRLKAKKTNSNKKTNADKKKKRAQHYIQIVLFSMILVFQLVIIGNQNCMMTMQSQLFQDIATLRLDRAPLNDSYAVLNERGE